MTLTGNIVYQKCLFDDASGTINPMFLFLTDAGTVTVYEQRDDGGVHHFLTYPLGAPQNQVNFAYKDFIYGQEFNGGIVVGAADSFGDINPTQNFLTGAAPSGFYYGFDRVNSCVIFDSSKSTSDETPNPYFSATITEKLGTELAAISETYSITGKTRGNHY